MGFAVCTINLKLVMESVTRKGRALDMSVSVPWPFSFMEVEYEFRQRDHN